MPDAAAKNPAPGHSRVVPITPTSRAEGTAPAPDLLPRPSGGTEIIPGAPIAIEPAADQAATEKVGERLRGLWRRLRRQKNEAVREVIEELIEESPQSDEPISEDQRVLLANILKLRDQTVADVMVPRVDIVSIQADTPLDEVVKLIQREAHSRYPVYRESLDDVIGMVHIKDVLAYWGTGKRFNLRDILRRVVFVAPTMPVLDMLLDMRRARTHMALVVDEFGGTDGVLTIEDLVEEIVGEIEDEHDIAESAQIVQRPDGTFEASGRVSIEEFEEKCGKVLSDDEREAVDTLGGLIFSLLGRIPERGEVVRHPTGAEFEILGVDPRRIRRLRIRPAPAPHLPAPSDG
jgi:magnesium and cobalt transporter